MPLYFAAKGVEMVGTELLETGQLAQAIERVAGELKAKPGDLAARTFYFELLSLNGDLDRASKQLEVLAAATGELGGGASVYLGAIQAEKERRQFFHTGPRPRVIGEPSYAKSYLEAVEHHAAGNSAAAATLLETAAQEERSLRGTLNGTEIHELSDSHDLLGPFLEVVMENHYAWVPWETIQSLAIPEPRHLRDTVWAPASLTLHSGDHGEVLVFSLYVDSHLQANDLKLGRRTVWEANPAGFTVAYGQKVIAAGDRDCPILEMRTLEVEACRLAA
jgi:type VI secretion system protein ImpE